jgi:hypothetical protein
VPLFLTDKLMKQNMDIGDPAYLINNWGRLIIFVIYQHKHYMLELLISFLQGILTYQYSVSKLQTSTKKLD